MNTVVLSWRYLWARPLAAGLNLLLMTLGLTSMTFVLLGQPPAGPCLRARSGGHRRRGGRQGQPDAADSGRRVPHRRAAGATSPLADVQALAKHPQVAQLIPLSLGDSFRGFRIVGTTLAYITHYQATLAQGAIWAAPMQAVVGAQVAAATGLKAGDRFEGSHGLGGGGDAHGHTPYTVAGVLAPCGCVLDRLILTATESVWKVHEDMHSGDTPLDKEEREALEAEREVTMALIRYTTPLAAVTFPRYVNSSTGMQSAAPAVEITRLLGHGRRRHAGAAGLWRGAAADGGSGRLHCAVERRARAPRGPGHAAHAGGATLEGGRAAAVRGTVAGAAGLGIGAAGGPRLDRCGRMVPAGRQIGRGGRLAMGCRRKSGCRWAALGVALLAALLPAVSAYRVDVARLLNAR
jgi:putative ABC transport system permease protein